MYPTNFNRRDFRGNKRFANFLRNIQFSFVKISVTPIPSRPNTESKQNDKQEFNCFSK